jgi:hypothetical protein
VPGRDDSLVSRLPSAAEPEPLEHNTELIYQVDVLDTSKINMEDFTDENLVPDTSLDYDNPLIDFDSPRLNVNLSLYDWIDENNDYDNDFLSSVKLPTTLPTAHRSHATDNDLCFITPVSALSALDNKISEVGITKSEFYDRLRSDDTHPMSESSVRAHFDGGSMATTTDQLHCLWYFAKLRDTDSIRMLQVADNNRHRPEGIGFLRIRILHNDSCFIRCLYIRGPK